MSGFDIGHKLNKAPRPPGDLENQLDRCIRLLRKSAVAFDEGDEDEALRMASDLRKLLHDHGTSSISLLKQLNIKQNMRFIDTGIYPDLLLKAQENLARSMGLKNVATTPGIAGLVEVHPQEDGTGKFAAPLCECAFGPDDFIRAAYLKNSDFLTWWNKPLVESSNGKIFSRSNIVLIIANQDNGAHVDPEVDADFQDLCRDTLGICIEFGKSIPQNITDIRELPPIEKSLPYACVRQITFEVLGSLDRFRLPIERGQFVLREPYERKTRMRAFAGPTLIMGQ